jgi:YD repeat-containing protein
MKHLIVRTGLIGLIVTSLSGLVAPTTAHARNPVSQCTAPGQVRSAQSLSKSQPMMMAASSQSGETPDADIRPIEPNMASFKPTIRSGANVGGVNLKTGAFSYSNEDISVGMGAFPARLHLTRTYSSDRSASETGGTYWSWVSAAAPEIRPFGIASTHNLDIRFRTGKQVFTQTLNGPIYNMLYVSFGLSTLAFQQCADGIYVSSNRDGSRIFADNTYSTGGFRLELEDGTKIFLFRFIDQACRSIHSVADTICGAARRWESPAGDWADFQYEQYYDRPDAAINSHLWQFRRIDAFPSSQQFCISTPTVANDCRQAGSNYYYMYPDNETRRNWPLYDMRLVRITTSRNYRAEFSYVDSTTNVGSVCSSMSPGPAPPTLVCAPPANESRNRSLIKDVKVYAGSSLIRQASYTYTDNQNSNRLYLNTYTAPDGRKLTYEVDIANGGVSVYRIYEGDNTSPPVTTVNLALANAALFQQIPSSTYLLNSGFTPLAYSKYPRVSSQVFADGRVVQYIPTFASKWITDTLFWNALRTNWRPVDYVAEMKVIEPGNLVTIARFDDEDAPLQKTDPLNRVTVNTYDDVGKLLTTTNPEGDKIVNTYDVRGNVIEVVRHPKQNSGLVPITVSKTYVGGQTLAANSCANQSTCNRPLTSTDGRGFTTNYTWDAPSGMLESITGPADRSGVRPSTTFGYTSFTGPVGGTLRLLTSKTDKVSASQNTVTNYAYDAANRFFPREILQDVGGLGLRACMKFDQAGVPVSETAPKANLANCP